MKLLKHLSAIGTAASMIFLGSCLEEENPCPDAVFTVDVDSSSFTYTITAEGLEDLVYQWHVNNDLVETEELNDLRDNILNFTFEPGTYNICIRAESEICDGVIEFCKEITIINDPCPWLEFEKEKIHWNKYNFEASFEHKGDILYTWYVDGDSIETAPFGENRWHAFDQVFEPGVHTVCIKQVDAPADCENDYCVEIAIEEPYCPTPNFGINHEGNYFVFTADFEGKNDTPYKWYINNDIADYENIAEHETDHKLEKEFAPGTYNVCVITYTNDCEPKEYCKEIIVEGEPVACRDLSYNAERDGDNFAYNFTTDFDGKNDVTYIWSIYKNDDYQGGEVRDAGSEDDHNFNWQFEAGVEYKVCLKQDGGCTESQVCKTFVID